VGNRPQISMERTISGVWTDRGTYWMHTMTDHSWQVRKLWLDGVSVKIIGSDYDVWATE